MTAPEIPTRNMLSDLNGTQYLLGPQVSVIVRDQDGGWLTLSDDDESVDLAPVFRAVTVARLRALADVIEGPV